jgi:stage V sporulation protein S
MNFKENFGMTEEMKKDINTGNDNALLLVSGNKGEKDLNRDYVKQLSNAIVQVFYKHNVTRLRCVGAAAVNNAIKSFIIARGEALKKGDELVIIPSFTTVKFQDEEKTGIVIEVKNIKDN